MDYRYLAAGREAHPASRPHAFTLTPFAPSARIALGRGTVKKYSFIGSHPARRRLRLVDHLVRRGRHLVWSIMHSAANDSRPILALWRRAWGFSFLFHLLMTAYLGLAVHYVWRGAAADSSETGGIVLLMAADSGELANPEIPPMELQAIMAMSSAPPAPHPHSVPSRWIDPLPDESQSETPPVEALPPRETLELPRLPSPLAADIAAARSAQQAAAGGRRSARRGARPGSIAGASQARISVFGVEGTGTKFVYLFDRSASMEGAPLLAAKRQLVESLRALDSIHQFQIIFFNSLPHPIDITGAGRMAFASEQNKRLAANVIGNVTADLGTDRYLALKEAISYSPDVIFFLTDAEDEMLPSELAEVERANERVGAAICVIEFGQSATPRAENFLKRLARHSGGQYGYISTGSLLP